MWSSYFSLFRCVRVEVRIQMISTQNNRNIRLEFVSFTIMLLQIVAVSAVAVYAAAADRRRALPLTLLQLLPCFRCSRNSATAAACCSCSQPLLPLASYLLAAADSVTTYRCSLCVCACIIISFCIMIRSMWTCETVAVTKHIMLTKNRQKPVLLKNLITVTLHLNCYQQNTI